MVTGQQTVEERLDAIERRLDNLEHEINPITQEDIIEAINEVVRRANHDTVEAMQEQCDMQSSEQGQCQND